MEPRKLVNGLSTISRMRNCCLILMLLVASVAYSQTRQQWRDSLEALSAQLQRTPADIDLRLRKAEANINPGSLDLGGGVGDVREVQGVLEEGDQQDHQRDDGRLALESDEETPQKLRHAGRLFLGLAHALQKMGRRTDTMDQLNTLVEQFPDSAAAYAARAAYETELKLYDVALYDWDEAIRRQPLNADFVVSKADILIGQGRNADARTCLSAGIRRGIPRYALKEWLDKCK